MTRVWAGLMMVVFLAGAGVGGDGAGSQPATRGWREGGGGGAEAAGLVDVLADVVKPLK